MVNFTCPVIPEKPVDPKPFIHDGQLDFKAHDVGWLICGIFALIATICSIWLIWKHLTYYTLPSQQRHIVRLLIMVPIYAIVSFMSYLFYHEALYYQTIRDCYEAVLVTSFFYLILAYTGDTRAEQHAVFRNVKLEKWFWPMGFWKYRPDGMHFLWLMKICVLQYAIVRPVCTLAAVGLQYFGYYCLASWMPWFGHVWCALLISISVTVAMYCLIQFYLPIKELVDPYKPVLKFLAVKTIVFLTFWQDTFLSLLVSFGVIKETEYFSAEEIQVGINALLQCFWMLLFGFIHIKAFSYRPYRPADKKRTTMRGRALLDVLDFRDWFWEMKESTQYVAARSKGRNFTLAEDIRADRHAHLEKALGRERKKAYDNEIEKERQVLPTFWKEPKKEEGEGLLKDEGRELDLHPHSRQLVGVPELEFEKEEADDGMQGVGAYGVAGRKEEKGWWRSFRERISGSGHEEENLEPLAQPVLPRIGKVTEGSWGDLRGRYVSESPISPDVESPLSRLINTHRDSLTPKERRSAVQSLAPQVEQAAPASSKQASVVPTEAGFTASTVGPSQATHATTFATVPEQPEEDAPLAAPPLTKSTLPEKAGPKGKPIKIVIPNPLSPSRYPYGQEGAAPAPSALASAPSAPTPAQEEPRREKPASPKEAKKETGMITIGAMSLAQTRAAAKTTESRQGRISLPAPSQLGAPAPGVTPDDPFIAGVKAHAPPPQTQRPTAAREGVSTTSHNTTRTNTAFEVGDVVSRGDVRTQQRADRYTNVPPRMARPQGRVVSMPPHAQYGYQHNAHGFQDTRHYQPAQHYHPSQQYQPAPQYQPPAQHFQRPPSFQPQPRRTSYQHPSPSGYQHQPQHTNQSRPPRSSFHFEYLD